MESTRDWWVEGAGSQCMGEGAQQCFGWDQGLTWKERRFPGWVGLGVRDFQREVGWQRDGSRYSRASTPSWGFVRPKCVDCVHGPLTSEREGDKRNVGDASVLVLLSRPLYCVSRHKITVLIGEISNHLCETHSTAALNVSSCCALLWHRLSMPEHTCEQTRGYFGVKEASSFNHRC